jgi:hypothetical protein
MMADWADGARARFVFFEFSVFAAAQMRAADVDLFNNFDIPVSLTSADGSSFTFLACMDSIGAHFRVHVAVSTIVYAGGNEGLSQVPESAVLTGGQWSIHDGVGERTGVPSAIAGYSSTAPFGIMERVTAYISDLVRAKAWFSLLSRLWQEMGDKETRAEVGYAFERYCYDVLCAPGVLEVRRISSNTWPALQAVSTTARSRSSVRLSLDYIPSSPNHPLIDAADRDDDGRLRAFQCTVATTHTADPADVAKMLNLFVHGESPPPPPHANGTLTTEAISSPVARLFFMVPSQYCSTFRLPANSRPYPEEVELYVMRVSPPVEHVVRTLPSDFLDSFAQWQNARAMARTEQAAPPAVPPNASEKERAKKRVKK